LTCLKLNAPISPHISDEIYLGMGFDQEEKEDGVQSIHQASWPRPATEMENDSAEQAVERMHFVLSEVRKYKAGKALALNSPLGRVKVLGNEAEIRELSDYEAELKEVGKISQVEAVVVPNAEGLKVEIG
jgi:valyl-tRNA synthetase